MAKSDKQPQYTKKFFGSHREAIDVLVQLEKCDLVSGLTPQDEAVQFCVKVLEILTQSQKLNFKDAKFLAVYDSLLKYYGCVTYNQASSKHILMPRAMMRDTFVPNNIQFALHVFTKLFNDGARGYDFIMSEEGSALLDKWLEIQYKAHPELKLKPKQSANNEKSTSI